MAVAVAAAVAAAALLRVNWVPARVVEGSKLAMLSSVAVV
jgi:hypothetical protein